MTLPDRIVTAGIYIWTGDAFVFMTGPTPDGSRLAVLRIGGHREPRETPWHCARREAAEEASVEVEPIMAATTWMVRAYEPEPALQPVPWPGAAPVPLLILPRPEDPDGPANAMFLARALTPPRPAHEAKGLLLLRPDEVRRIAAGPITLAEYLAGGGRALLRAPLPEHLPLFPAAQARVLAWLLDHHPHRLEGCS